MNRAKGWESLADRDGEWKKAQYSRGYIPFPQVGYVSSLDGIFVIL